MKVTKVGIKESKIHGCGNVYLQIPTVIDCVVQQAISQILSSMFEPQFCETSYCFRPRKCT